MTTKRRNRMVAFTINELSAVDRPAQTHARAVLMKRADPAPEQEQPTMQKILTRDQPRSFDSLEDAVKAIQVDQECAAHEAMSQAAREHPHLVKAYNAEGAQQVTKALEQMRQPTLPPAVAEFNALVDRIRERDMCTGTEALRRAKAEDPDLFRRYQSA